MDQAFFQKLADHRRSAAFDIHGALAGKMDETFAAQGGTMGIGAAISGFAFFTLNIPATFRAFIRHGKRLCSLRALRLHHVQDLGNNFGSLVNDHHVADADIFFLDKIFVMESSTADGTAGKLDRCQHRGRCQNAGPPYLDHNVQEFGLGLFRRIFIGDGPAGIFARGAQDILLPHVVDLGYGAIGIVGQVGSALSVLRDKPVNLGFRKGNSPVFRGFKTVAGKHLQRLRMFCLSTGAYAIGEKA